VLFSSAAAVVRIPIVAVVLTGMGSDGADGVFELKKSGALVITQAEETCTVYGMPKAVDERGLSDVSLSPERIPDYIMRNSGSVKRRIVGPVDEFRIGL
jgi:two-component system chemotaxis response regulator CheB